MASRAENQLQPPPAKPKGGPKQKNVPAEPRNRRVLQDIGNLSKVPDRPLTRSFCAQLLANAQAVQEKKKSVTDVVGRVVTDGVVQKKLQEKAKSEVVVILSTGKKDKSKLSGGRRRSKGASSREKVSLSSVLTARSKAAGTRPVNIDAEDAENELAVVEYIEDLYKFYKLTEEENELRNYLNLQPDMNAKMRSILVDWLIEVHNKFELMPETLYLTINLVDRYLSVKVVPRRELQLLGIGSMLIASKYEEIWAPEVNDLVCISDNAYTREQILRMEKAILGKLDWYLTVPTPYVFLKRYIKASLPWSEEMENLVFFLAELGLMDYSSMTQYRPSKFAASAVYAARCTLENSPLWSECLKEHTSYPEDQLMDCAKMLVSFHSSAAESRLRSVYKKYSRAGHGAVALLSPAKSLLAAASNSS